MSRFTFKKNERLCSVKAIDELYTAGTPMHGPVLKAVFLITGEPQPAPCRVVFSVPKRSFKKAVTRNLIKRRVREAYRLHKDILCKVLMEKNIFLHLMFIYTAKDENEYGVIEAEMQKMLKTVSKKATE